MLTQSQRERKRLKDRIAKQKHKKTERDRLMMLERELAELRSSANDGMRKRVLLGPPADSARPDAMVSQRVLASSCRQEFPFPSVDISLGLSASSLDRHASPIRPMQSNSPFSLQSSPGMSSTTQLSLPALDRSVSDPIPGPSSDNKVVDAQTTGCDQTTECYQTKLDRLADAFTNDEGTGLLDQFNQVFGNLYTIRRDDICVHEKLNQDALVCGVVEGWEKLQYKKQVCPLWDILRQIDEGLFLFSGTMTRLCMLRMVHFMLLVRESSTTKMTFELTRTVVPPGSQDFQ